MTVREKALKGTGTGATKSHSPVTAKPGKITARPPKQPTVVLSEQAADFMSEVCKIAKSNEVGGMGYVDYDPSSREFYVSEVFLVPQEVSGGHVTIEGEAVAWAMERAFADGKLDQLKFSWHSHNNMQVFWSQTDEGGINTYLNGGADWLLSIVTNNDGHMLARFDLTGVPLLGRQVYDKLDVEIEVSDPTNGEAAAQFAEHVKVQTWTRATPTWKPKPGAKQPAQIMSANSAGANRSQQIGDKLDAALTLVASKDDYDAQGLTVSERKELNDAGLSDDAINQMDEDTLLDAQIAVSLHNAGLTDISASVIGESGAQDLNAQAWGMIEGGEDQAWFDSRGGTLPEIIDGEYVDVSDEQQIDAKRVA